MSLRAESGTPAPTQDDKFAAPAAPAPPPLAPPPATDARRIASRRASSQRSANWSSAHAACRSSCGCDAHHACRGDNARIVEPAREWLRCRRGGMIRGGGGDRQGRVRLAHLQKCNLALRVLQRRFGRGRATAPAASAFAPTFAPVAAAATAAARLLARAGTHRFRRRNEQLGERTQRERDVTTVGAEHLAVTHAGGAKGCRGAQAGCRVGGLGDAQQRLVCGGVRAVERAAQRAREHERGRLVRVRARVRARARARVRAGVGMSLSRRHRRVGRVVGWSAAEEAVAVGVAQHELEHREAQRRRHRPRRQRRQCGQPRRRKRRALPRRRRCELFGAVAPALCTRARLDGTRRHESPPRGWLRQRRTERAIRHLPPKGAPLGGREVLLGERAAVLEHRCEPPDALVLRLLALARLLLARLLPARRLLRTLLARFLVARLGAVSQRPLVVARERGEHLAPRRRRGLGRAQLLRGLRLVERLRAPLAVGAVAHEAAGLHGAPGALVLGELQGTHATDARHRSEGDWHWVVWLLHFGGRLHFGYGGGHGRACGLACAGDRSLNAAAGRGLESGRRVTGKSSCGNGKILERRNDRLNDGPLRSPRRRAPAPPPRPGRRPRRAAGREAGRGRCGRRAA
eukprot:scaffold7137_cov56-Phaeocystis_antarctica.AAC.2